MGLQQLEATLDVGPDGEFRINDIQFVRWGRDLVFTCEHRAGESAVPLAFTLMFTDCRELRWKTYAHVAESSLIPSAMLVDFAPGQGNHRKEAALLTTHFAATISYGEAYLELRDRRVRL